MYIPKKLYILDQLVISSNAAYALKRLSKNYTGPLILVRRSLDNTQRNIYFTSDGNLDIADLLSFCGSGSGYVVTWYDSTGNGNNAIQLTATYQPVIVLNGILQTINGNPAINFSASNPNYLISNSFYLTLTGAWTSNVILQFSSNGAESFSSYLAHNSYSGSGSPTGDFWQRLVNSTNQLQIVPYSSNGTNESYTSPVENNLLTQLNIISVIQNNTVLTTYINGNLVGTKSISLPMATLNSPILIGSSGTGVGYYFMNGLINLITLFPSGQTINDHQMLEHWEEFKFNISGL